MDSSLDLCLCRIDVVVVCFSYHYFGSVDPLCSCVLTHTPGFLVFEECLFCLLLFLILIYVGLYSLDFLVGHTTTFFKSTLSNRLVFKST